MLALVSVNGDCDSAVLQRLTSSRPDLVVAVDGGLRHVLALQKPVDWLIGDMDSVDNSLLTDQLQRQTSVLRHPVEKDATDLELALEHLTTLGVERVILIGIDGGRLDHTLANLLLLAQRDWPFQLEFRSAHGNGVLLTPDVTYEGRLAVRTQLSLLPLSSVVEGVSCSGLYYPLRNASICFGSTLGVSNVVVESAVCVSVTAGKLLLVYQPA